MEKIQSTLNDLKEKTRHVPKKLYSRSKLPFFTLAFILSALIITVIAVQQQQNLVQNAQEIADCPTGTDNGDNNTTTGNPDRDATQAAKQATRAARRGEDGRSATTVVTQGATVQITIHTTEVPPNVVKQSVNLGSLASNPRANQRIKGQYIVKYKAGGSTASVDEKVRKHKGRTKKRIAKLRLDVVQVPETEDAATAGDLRSDPNVSGVYPDFYVSVGFTPNDTDFNKLYGIQKIHAPEAWDVTKGKNSVKVAVLDTGIDKSHADLSGKVVGEKNFIGGNDVNDDHGHGTHVAGTIAAIGDNGKGVIGVCPECSLLVGKVLDGNESGPVSGIIDGINWAVENHANVISMSLGVAQDRSLLTPLEDAVNSAVSSGVVVVAIAGNCGDNNFQANHCDSQNKVMYPGGYDNVIAVSATDEQDHKTSWSNSGSYVDVAAPGNNIYSTWPGGGYHVLSGTSQATPHVSGLAGLLFSQGLSANQIIDKIENTADDVQGTGSQHGRINAATAVGSTNVNPTDGTNPTDVTANPSKTKSPNPCKTPKAHKSPKPTKNPDSRGNNNNKNFICRLAPNLPMCKNQSDCNPNKTKDDKNKTKDSGKDGKDKTSNKDGSTDTNGGSTTEINIDRNGGTQTSDQSGGNGNTQTNTSNGQNGTTNRNENAGDCGNNNNQNNNKDKKKNGGTSLLCRLAPFLKSCKDNNDNNNNGNNNGGKNKCERNNDCKDYQECKQGKCELKKNSCEKDNDCKSDESCKQHSCEKKNSNTGGGGGGNNQCNKNSDCKSNETCHQNKCEPKATVQGASTINSFLIDDNILFACMAGEKTCTPEDRKVSDLNKDGKVNRLDYETFKRAAQP